MYRMMIIDDEPYVRRGLKKLTEWEKYGIEIIGEAANGKQAYDVIKKEKPDLILTDIYMPKMDGLELAKKVTDISPYAKVILLSGYEDFQYAQTAIRNDAFDYILKPIEKDKLLNVIEKAKKQIKKEIDKSKKEEELKEQLQQNLPVLKERYLNYIFNNSFSFNYVLENHKYLNLNLNKQRFVLLIFLLGDKQKDIKDKQKEQLIMIDINNIINGILTENYKGEIVTDYPDRFVVLLNYPDNESNNTTLNRLYQMFKKINKKVFELYNISLKAGIGCFYLDSEKISDSYKEALEALEYRIFPGTGDIIYINDVSVVETKNKFVYPVKLEKKIITAIKIGDINQSEIYSNEFIKQLLNSKNICPDTFKKLVLKLVYSIIRKVMEWNISIEIVKREERKIEEQINKCYSIDILKSCLVDFIKNLAKINNTKKENSYKKMINEVYRYIQDNYQKDISLDDIASYIGFTPNYLANIFKEKTGKTVISYLINYRINKAKSLLTKTDLKIYQISNKVGYNNPNYFSQVFKNNVGVSPNQYKQATNEKLKD